MTPLERVAAIEAAAPPEGLFADKSWLVSPEPFSIDAAFAEELEKLGYRLQLFNRACNLLYQQSATGKQPAWIADYLDRGKPPELIEFSRRKEFRDDLPRVIRPDLILTDDGFTIAELDTVPGGIGLTHWLNATYAALGNDILGGASGMLDGFSKMLGGSADIVISEEAATYRPEMEYLSRLSGGALQVFDTAPANPQPTLYRFFELFDLPNIPTAAAMLDAASAGKISITPPIKPFLEEKLWFALFWMRPLREFWRRELSERHFLKLQKVIPYTWILDPTALPQHAVIPGLDVHDWGEVMRFSQKQRDLILKISGFSEIGWGSRSVTLGSDAPQAEWHTAIQRGLDEFPHHPWILQRFHKGRIVEQPFRDPKAGEIVSLRGRVRLCPYYFVHDNRTHLGGALATVAPADKKLLHGMKDAILTPTAVK